MTDINEVVESRCKYCGAKGYYVYDGLYHQVICSRCRYRTPICPDRLIGEDEESKLTVINYWNTGVLP